MKSGNKNRTVLPAALATAEAWYGRQNKTYQLAEDAVEGRYELPEIAYRQNRNC